MPPAPLPIPMPVIRVALDVPLHRQFDYLAPDAQPDDVGRRVRAPFGRGTRIGVITAVLGADEEGDLPLDKLKAAEILRDDVPPLPPDWFRLTEFCSSYYQAPIGEVMLAALPVGLRRTDPPKARTVKAKVKAEAPQVAPELTPGQAPLPQAGSRPNLQPNSQP